MDDVKGSQAQSVVLDSNVLVAAGFNKRSSSARLVEWIRAGRLRMVWHQATLEETRLQLRKIPPLSWEPFADLYRPADEVEEPLEVGEFPFIDDPDDRKFAALAEQTGATLVSNDQHLLSAAQRLAVPVLTPKEAVASLG